MKILVAPKTIKPFEGKKLTLLSYIWERSIFRFSKYSFFLNFFFSRLTYFSLLLQAKSFNFFDEANFRYSNFKKTFEFSKLVAFLNSRWDNSENYFFCEFKILGLGLRMKKTNQQNLRSVSLDLGFSHYIEYPFPLEVKCIRRKKKFVIFSYDVVILNNVIQHLENFKPLNPYKIRGLKNVRRLLVTKVGKKQSQR
jgi:hypothetical protein